MNYSRHHIELGEQQAAAGGTHSSFRGSHNLREKRQHPRATLVTPVQIYRVVRAEAPPSSEGAVESPAQVRARNSPSRPCVDESSMVEAESRDISHGGMFLSGEAPCPVGTELVMIFELPKIGRAQIPGFVRWHRADGFGVQFGLLGARETHAIGQLIRGQS